MKKYFLGIVIIILISGITPTLKAQSKLGVPFPPSSSAHTIQPPASFEAAKRIAREKLYADRPITFYCGCKYIPQGKSGGTIDLESCNYVPRKMSKRAIRLEWEHVMPAWFFGHYRECWKQGGKQCIDSKGKRYKGRECCRKVDAGFRRMEADLMNIVPEGGELNAARSNYPYGIVPGEKRAYGPCDFEVGNGIVEPGESIRGIIAHIWFYMRDTYHIPLSKETEALLKKWKATYPVPDWEKKREGRIKTLQ